MNDLLLACLAAQGGLVTAGEARDCGYTSVSLSRLVVSGSCSGLGQDASWTVAW